MKYYIKKLYAYLLPYQQKVVSTYKNINQSDLFAYIKKQRSLKIAIIGFTAAIIFSLVRGGHEVIPPNQIHFPSPSPFTKSISGNGFVEANTRNIKLGSFQSGIVMDVFVKEGDRIKKGDVLFKLDDRLAQTQANLAQSTLQSAKSAVDIAKAQLDEAFDQFSRAKQLKNGILASEEMKRRQFAYEKAKAQIALEEAKCKQAEHNLKLAEINLEQCSIKSPIDGLVLKINTLIGEYVSAPTSGNGLFIIGNDSPLYLRVQLDESDAIFFEPTAKAVAFFKNKTSDPIPLRLIRLEPYAAPKKQLRGDSQEWVDTRIVEVIYELPKTESTFIGQQVDVFIERS